MGSWHRLTEYLCVRPAARLATAPTAALGPETFEKGLGYQHCCPTPATADRQRGARVFEMLGKANPTQIAQIGDTSIAEGNRIYAEGD